MEGIETLVWSTQQEKKHQNQLNSDMEDGSQSFEGSRTVGCLYFRICICFAFVFTLLLMAASLLPVVLSDRIAHLVPAAAA